MAAGLRRKIGEALDSLEASPPTSLTIGEISLGSALAHLDFRFADEPWRPGRPKLAAWFQTFSERPSMQATPFVDRY
jgi:hypothetical protein